MTGNYDDIPYPPDYGAPHRTSIRSETEIRAEIDALNADWVSLVNASGDWVRYEKFKILNRLSVLRWVLNEQDL